MTLTTFKDGDRVKLGRVLANDPDHVREHIGRTGYVRTIDRHGIHHVELESLPGEFGIHMLELSPINLEPAPAAAAADDGSAEDPAYAANRQRIDRLLEEGEQIIGVRQTRMNLAAAAVAAQRRAWWAKAVAGAHPWFGPLADRIADEPPDDFLLDGLGQGPERYEVSVRPFGEVELRLILVRQIHPEAPMVAGYSVGTLPTYRVVTEWRPGADEPEPARTTETPYLAEALALAKRSEPLWDHAMAAGTKAKERQAAEAKRSLRELLSGLAEVFRVDPAARPDGNGHLNGTERVGAAG